MAFSNQFYTPEQRSPPLPLVALCGCPEHHEELGHHFTYSHKPPLVCLSATDPLEQFAQRAFGELYSASHNRVPPKLCFFHDLFSKRLSFVLTLVRRATQAPHNPECAPRHRQGESLRIMPHHASTLVDGTPFVCPYMLHASGAQTTGRRSCALQTWLQGEWYSKHRVKKPAAAIALVPRQASVCTCKQVYGAQAALVCARVQSSWGIYAGISLPSR